MTEEERIIDAGYAQQALDNPALQRVLEHLRNSAIKKLEKVDNQDQVAKDSYVRSLQVVTAISDGLTKILKDGKMAEVTLEERNLFKRNVRV